MILSTTDLHCTLGGKDILRGLSLNFRPGELVGIIGPNGAGKSTLIRHLTGYLRPRGGKVLLDGRDLAGISAKERARHIAWVSQGQDAIPAFPFRVREVVEMGRYPHRSFGQGLGSEDRETVERVLSYLDLGDQADQTIDTLSGGERQRALFARALAQASPILLLDEPSASLDLAQEHRLFGMLGELSREGRVVLAAVHNLNTAAEYCDRLVLLHRGQVSADGGPEEVLTPARLKTVFGIDAQVAPNPHTGTPVVHHAPPLQTATLPRVHVIGGAGAALNVTRLLVRLGYRVTGGIAHGLDTDAALWQNLGLDHIRVAPFSHIDDQTLAQARALVEAAAITVLCDIPFGPGNRRNLDLAARAPRLVVLDEETHHGERRFYQDGIEAQYQALCSDPRTLVCTWKTFEELAETLALG